MPNQPKTSKMGWRIPDEIKDEIKRVARDNGETATALVIRAIIRELRRHPGSRL